MEKGGCAEQKARAVGALLIRVRAVELVCTTDCAVESLRSFNNSEGGLSRSLESLE